MCGCRGLYFLVCSGVSVIEQCFCRYYYYYYYHHHHRRRRRRRRRIRKGGEGGDLPHPSRPALESTQPPVFIQLVPRLKNE